MRPARLWADMDGLEFTIESTRAVAPLFSEHYLGPLWAGKHAFAGWIGSDMVAAMIWRHPTARMLPSDGSWLELSRWCLTAEAGKNAGSRMMAWVVRWLRANDPAVQVLVSYSDPSRGHTGALYKACNWTWSPTWLRLSPPPSGNGSWNGKSPQAVKDRWVYAIGHSSPRAAGEGAEGTAPELFLRAPAPPGSGQRTEEQRYPQAGSFL